MSPTVVTELLNILSKEYFCAKPNTLPTSLTPAKQSNPSPVSLTPAISFLPAIADTIWNFLKKNFNDENV